MTPIESKRLDEISEAACYKVAQDIDATALLYGTPIVVVRHGKIIEMMPKNLDQLKHVADS